MSIHCPSCGTAYPKQDGVGGWITCPSCNHIWCMVGGDDRGTEAIRNDTQAAVTSPAAGTTVPPGSDEPAAPAVASAAEDPAGRIKSGEYLPDTNPVRRSTEAALTGRHASSPGIRDALAKIKESVERETAARGGRPGASGGGPESASIDLFGQIERQLDRERADNRTMEVPDFGAAGSAEVPEAEPVPSSEYDEEDERALTIPDDPTRIERGGDPFIGREIGGCLIDRKLGEGGMGSVYHASQLRLDRSVALKILPPELKRNTKFLKRFEHEAKALARINHPNILHIYDFGEDRQHAVYYMIMEYVAGEDMAELLRRNRRLDQIAVFDIVRQSLLGLEAAAANGVVHRDIKPDNLMITAEGICKVSDFGLAKDAEALTQVTNMGVRVGTPAFMSPEQCDGESLDFRSDVYSLGVTAYVGLTGTLPFSGESPFAIMLKHKTDAPPSARERVPGIDPEVDRLVRTMMAKLPGDRCQSLEQLRADLEAILSRLRSGGTSRPGTEMLGKGERFEDPPDVVGSEGLPPLPDGMLDRRSGSASPAPTGTPPPAIPSAPAASPDQLHFPLPRAAPNGPVVPVGPPSLAPSSPQTPPPHPNSASRIGSRPAGKRVQSGVRSRPGESGRRQAGSGEAPRMNTTRVISLEEEGDRAFAQGKVAEAIVAWQQASRLAGAWEIRERLFRKVDGVRGKQRSARRRVWTLLLVLLVAGTYGAGWWGMPRIYEMLVVREVALAEAAGDLVAQREAYSDLLGRYGQPPWWARLFLCTERAPSVVTAVQRCDELQEEIAAGTRTLTFDRELAKVRELYEQGGAWSAILQACAAIGQGGTPEQQQWLAAVRVEAETALADLDAHIQALAAVRAEGDIAGVLRLASELRQRGRLGDREARLPSLQDIQIVSAAQDRSLPANLTMVFDGHRLERVPETVYRYPGEDIPIEISAPGHLRLRSVVPAGGTATAPLRFELRHAIDWSQEVPGITGEAAWSTFHILDSQRGLVVLHGDDGLLCFDAVDGRAQWAAGPADLVSGADQQTDWTGLWNVEGGAAIVSTAVGDVVRIDLAGTPVDGRPRGEVVQSLRHPVVARVQRDLRLIQGGQAVITLLALPEEEGWSLQRTVRRAGGIVGEIDEPFAMPRGLAPELIGHGERLYLLTDDTLFKLDEQGHKEAGRRSITPKRTRSSAYLDSGSVLVVPGDQQLQAIHLAAPGDSIPILEEVHQVPSGVVLVQGAPDGRGIAVLDAEGRLTKLQWRKKSWHSAWSHRLAGSIRGRPTVWIGRDRIVVSDDAGAIDVLERDSGVLQSSFDHRRPTLAMAVVRDRLLVHDGGQLTAYLLEE